MQRSSIFWHFKKSLPIPDLFSAYLSFLSSFSPLTHSPLHLSYSAVLFVHCPPLPMPPTCLLIHPLGEQYSRVLTTVIPIVYELQGLEGGHTKTGSICRNWKKKKRVHGSHYECISHMSKVGQQLFNVWAALWLHLQAPRCKHPPSLKDNTHAYGETHTHKQVFEPGKSPRLRRLVMTGWQDVNDSWLTAPCGFSSAVCPG